MRSSFSYGYNILIADSPLISSAALGELCSSPFANFWIERYTKAHGRRPSPEYRLFSTYVPFVLVIIGLIVFGVTLQKNGPKHYNVAPVVGIAIANFGNQIITSILFSCTWCSSLTMQARHVLSSNAAYQISLTATQPNPHRLGSA